uniref:Cannabinoid receptor 2 n=2 Tax=Poecilia reticulata TaxID=8081 RepID=A0A3P9NI13_POERE
MLRLPDLNNLHFDMFLPEYAADQKARSEMGEVKERTCSNSSNPNASSQIANEFCDSLQIYMVLTDLEKKAIGTICFLGGPITLMENVLVLGVIASSAMLRRKPSYLFIGSLALADVFASCFFTTSFLDFHLFRRCDGPTGYLFKLGGVTMAFSSSVGSLLLTALDRYLCIHQASSYKVLLTRRRATLSLLILWSITIFISFLPLMGWRCPTVLNPPCSCLFPFISPAYLACWTTFILILLTLILVAYALILWKAHRHESSMTNLQGSSGARQARMRIDIRLARTFGLILLILVGSWLPVLTFMLVDVSIYLTRNQQRAFAFCSTLCLLNSAVNPLLYALRCRELRIALLQCLPMSCGFWKCQNSTNDLNLAGQFAEDNCATVSDDTLAARTPQLHSVCEIVNSKSS